MRLTRSLFIKTALLGAIAAAGLLAWQPLHAAEEAVVIPPPAQDQPAGDGLETAVVAGGCFWGVQGVYQHVKGVSNAVSGYAGGDAKTASYTSVTSGMASGAVLGFEYVAMPRISAASASDRAPRSQRLAGSATSL